MFHPHHLLFIPIVHFIFLAVSSLGGPCDAICAAQFHNIMWAIVTVLSCYFAVRHLLVSNLFGVLAGISLLITQGFWMYSTQADVYIPAMGCLALIAAILIVHDNPNLTITKAMIFNLQLITI